MLRKNMRVWVAGFALLCLPATTWAQVAPPLGTTAQFGVLANSGVTGSTATGTLVTGDVGSSPTFTIINFPPSRAGLPNIVHYTNDGVVQQARIASIAAYNALLLQQTGSTVLPDNLASSPILTSGNYSFVTGAALLPTTTTLTLNGPGTFVFNVGSSLTADVLSNVVGTADPCLIFWRVGTSATLNGGNFRGTVIADASITIGAGANLQGRALAGTGATGAVTMAGSGGNTIGGCSAAPACPVITVGPPTMPGGTAGVAYPTQTLTATGGTGAYTFTVVSGTLPAGLTLTPAGVLAGTPTTGGSSTFVVQATDGNACPGLITYTVIVTAAVPTLPQVFLVLLILGLGGVGLFQLRRRESAQ